MEFAYSRYLRQTARCRCSEQTARSRSSEQTARSRSSEWTTRSGSSALSRPRVESGRRSTIVAIWMKSGYCRNLRCRRSSDIDEVWKKFGVGSSVARRSLEGIRRIVDYCRRSADSEAQRAFGAARQMNGEAHCRRSSEARTVEGVQRDATQGRKPKKPQKGRSFTNFDHGVFYTQQN